MEKIPKQNITTTINAATTTTASTNITTTKTISAATTVVRSTGVSSISQQSDAKLPVVKECKYNIKTHDSESQGQEEAQQCDH